MGGIADARTNGLGFAGAAADSSEANPVGEKGAAARVDVVVVGIGAGVLPRIGTCAMADDVGGVPRPAAGREVSHGMRSHVVMRMTNNGILASLDHKHPVT